MLNEEERKARLAYWISDMRRRRGLTPPKLAALVGVSRSTVNKWESGDSVPSLIYLGPLATALGVKPGLFADLPTIPPSGAAEYLVEQAVAAGVTEGVARARRPRADAVPSEPEQPPERPSPSSDPI